MIDETTTDGAAPLTVGAWDRFALPLEELRRDLAVAIAGHRAAERTLARVKAVAELMAEEKPAYSICKNEGERARFIAYRLVEHAEYQAAVEEEAEMAADVLFLQAEIQVREDARRERQMAQRDRELDILAGNLAFDERKQDHLDNQAIAISEQLDALRATMEAVHEAHETDDMPISAKVGRA